MTLIKADSTEALKIQQKICVIRPIRVIRVQKASIDDHIKCPPYECCFTTRHGWTIATVARPPADAHPPLRRREVGFQNLRRLDQQSKNGILLGGTPARRLLR